MNDDAPAIYVGIVDCEENWIDGGSMVGSKLVLNLMNVNQLVNDNQQTCPYEDGHYEYSFGEI